MNPKLARVHQMIVRVNPRQVSVQSVSHLSKYWHQYQGVVGRWEGVGMHMLTCVHMCAFRKRERWMCRQSCAYRLTRGQASHC